jgi:hypothetical protein
MDTHYPGFYRGGVCHGHESHTVSAGDVAV